MPITIASVLLLSFVIGCVFIALGFWLHHRNPESNAEILAIAGLFFALTSLPILIAILALQAIAGLFQ